jgi:hypothetical protein
MRSANLTVVALVLTISFAVSVDAQVISQSTRAPLVSAEAERWYLAGDPITYSGHLYYPSGAQIHFNASEMVRSGFYQGIPLYMRTTIEPYSVVLVPVQGGMMQPYERRRDGELAGTAGSTAPSLPTASTPYEPTEWVPQAAAPPMLVGDTPFREDRPAAVGTAGSPDRAPAPESAAGSTPTIPLWTHIGPPPKGINAIFLDFDGRRWYSAGPAIPYDPAHMTRIGEHRGFSIFADTASPSTRIYIQSVAGGAMVAPYSINRIQE